MKLKYKKIKTKFCVIAASLLVVFAVSLLKTTEYIAEYVFARGISRFIVTIISFITSFLPFSLLELILVIIIIAVIIAIVKIIKMSSNKSYIKTTNYVLGIVMCVSLVFAVYNVGASANYYRKELPVNYADVDLDAEIILEAARFFRDDLNEIGRKLERDEIGNVINPYSRLEFAEIMKNEMKRLNNSYFNSYTPYYKNLIFSQVMDMMGLGGVFFSPTGEAHVSTYSKACNIPYTIVHELAHAKGVMRENEANLVADYITLTSENDFIRYSGYMRVFFSSIMNSVRVSQDEDVYREFYFSVDSKIREEYFRYDEPNKLEETLTKISNYMNDFYLKLSGVKDGTDSYNPGRAIELPPIIIDEDIVKVYYLTKTQRQIYQLYLDNN